MTVKAEKTGGEIMPQVTPINCGVLPIHTDSNSYKLVLEKTEKRTYHKVLYELSPLMIKDTQQEESKDRVWQLSMISAHQCAEVPQNSCEKAEISTSWLIYISGERKK